MRVELNLPMPPSVNGYWRSFRGRQIISERGRNYKTAVARYVMAERIPSFGDRKVRVEVVLYANDRRKRDLDNICKGIFDSLQAAGVLDDDANIDVLHIERGPIIKGGGVRVIIETLKLGES